MYFLTILSSAILLAGARPVPQSDSVSAATVDGNNTSIILSSTIPFLASTSATASTSLASNSSSSGLASLTATASIASASGTNSSDSAALTASDSIDFASATDSAVATATDLSLPSASSNDTTFSFPTDTPDDSDTDFPLPTATASDNNTIVTATSAASNGTTPSFSIPTAIPSACIAKRSNVSSSSVITASIPDSTDSASVDDGSFNTTFLSIFTGTDVGAIATSVLASDSALFTSAASGSVSIDSSVLASATLSSDSPLATASVNTTLNSTDSSNTTSTLFRRIAQADLPDVAQSWQDLCLVSGGDIFTNEPCVQLAGVNGINALLADAGPCDQQDNADAMIDFAKSAGVTNSDALIANAIAYRQHPRNSLDVNGVVPATPYCQKAPRNQELQSVVNAQLAGVDPAIYGGPNFGLVAFGDPSTCPFGTSPDVDTCGCS